MYDKLVMDNVDNNFETEFGMRYSAYIYPEVSYRAIDYTCSFSLILLAKCNIFAQLRFKSYDTSNVVPGLLGIYQVIKMTLAVRPKEYYRILLCRKMLCLDRTTFRLY